MRSLAYFTSTCTRTPDISLISHSFTFYTFLYHYFAWNDSISRFQLVSDGQKDGRTDWPMDQWMDLPSCRDARTPLKPGYNSLRDLKSLAFVNVYCCCRIFEIILWWWHTVAPCYTGPVSNRISLIMEAGYQSNEKFSLYHILAKTEFHL